MLAYKPPGDCPTTFIFVAPQRAVKEVFNNVIIRVPKQIINYHHGLVERNLYAMNEDGEELERNLTKDLLVDGETYCLFEL